MSLVPGDRVRLLKVFISGASPPVGTVGTVVRQSIFTTVVWDGFGGSWFMEGPNWAHPELALVPPLELLAEQAE